MSSEEALDDTLCWVDLHQRRSVIVVLDGTGTELRSRRIDNDHPWVLGLESAEAGPCPEVGVEATWGWYWAADVITGGGWPGAFGAIDLPLPRDRISTRLSSSPVGSSWRLAVCRTLIST